MGVASPLLFLAFAKVFAPDPLPVSLDGADVTPSAAPSCLQTEELQGFLHVALLIFSLAVGLETVRSLPHSVC